MNLLTTGLFYLYIILLAFFDVGSFYYTYRITKIVGVFRGWIAMLAFVVVFAAEGIIIFGLSVATAIFNPSVLDKALQGPNASAQLGTGLYSLLTAALLFGAMFELYRTFKRVSSKPPDRPAEESKS